MSVCEDARALFLEVLEDEERKSDRTIPLTRFMKSTAGRILELTQDFQHINDRSWLPMDNIHELIGLMYGDKVSWDEVRKGALLDLNIS